MQGNTKFRLRLSLAVAPLYRRGNRIGWGAVRGLRLVAKVAARGGGHPRGGPPTSGRFRGRPAYGRVWRRAPTRGAPTGLSRGVPAGRGARASSSRIRAEASRRGSSSRAETAPGAEMRIRASTAALGAVGRRYTCLRYPPPHPRNAHRRGSGPALARVVASNGGSSTPSPLYLCALAGPAGLAMLRVRASRSSAAISTRAT